jgi:ATP-dependent helicase HepA
VEIVFFRPPAGIGRDVASVFEAIGLFAEPLAGLEPELAPVEAAIESAALDPAGSLSDGELHRLLETARAAKTRIREAAYRELHRDPFRPEMGDGILARVPPDLDSLNEDVVVALCERLGFHVESHERRRAFSIEFGGEALVDSLPGVSGGASHLGSFDRETAVADETLDFFAAGHPLVEGLLAFLDEAPIGRVTALRVALGDEPGLGLLALYKDGPSFETVVLDAHGRSRPEWATLLRQRPLRTRRLDSDVVVAHPEWAKTMRRLGKRLPSARTPVALAALVVGP